MIVPPTSQNDTCTILRQLPHVSIGVYLILVNKLDLYDGFLSIRFLQTVNCSSGGIDDDGMNSETLETPKKSVTKKGRKRKGDEPSQFCRICCRPFVITYGNFSSKTGYISTENNFTVPQKKGLTKPLFSYLEDLRFHLETGEQFSTRVCSKVRAAVATVYHLKNNLNQPAPSTSIPNEVNERSKRMSNSPHQMQQKKILRSSSPPKKSAAKRSLCLLQK